MADRGGRKMLLLSSGVPNFVGWLLIVLSRYTLDAFRPVILTGRFLIGFAVGWLTSGIPVSVIYRITVGNITLFLCPLLMNAKVASSSDLCSTSSKLYILCQV